MKLLSLILLLGLLVFALLLAAPGNRMFTGTITDSMCATADHSRMKMGPTAAACVLACISEHGALYVLYDGKQVYTLNDQQTPARFAGRKVTVTGTLDAKAGILRMAAIVPAK